MKNKLWQVISEKNNQKVFDEKLYDYSESIFNQDFGYEKKKLR